MLLCKSQHFGLLAVQPVDLIPLSSISLSLLIIISTIQGHCELKREYTIKATSTVQWLGGSVVKNPPVNAGNTGSIPGLGRSPGEGNGNPLQYSCLKNPVDRGAWQATVHGVVSQRVRHD